MNSQTKTNFMTTDTPEVQQIHDLLALQQSAYRRYPLPTANERIERLARLKKVLIKYQDDIAEAINKDYGNRAI